MKQPVRLLAIGALIFCSSVQPIIAQPGTANLTPTQPFAMHEVTVEVPAKYRGLFPQGRKLTVPVGYKVRLYHIGGMSKPRFMSFDNKGVLHVADMTLGRVFAMPDNNGDGIADTIFTAADNFSVSHDVKFYKGAMYVTNERRVWKLTDTNNDGIYETRTVFIDSIAEGATQPGGGHRTRTLVFDSVNAHAYLSIGSLCNVCREEFRAVIERYNEDGSGKEIYANGVRNAVGMDIQPATRKLWANNNGSDRQGNETPPEWIDVIRKGGFYGYPFAYGHQKWFDMNAHADYQALLPINAADSAQVRKMQPPAALIRAHTAPMALQFLNSSFPTSMRHGMLSALRGSWNAPGSHRGFGVIYLHLNDANDTTVDYTATFVSGFLTDSISRSYWGRPVGIAVNNKGEVFISSDESSACILQVYPDGTTGMKEPFEQNSFHIFPNPSEQNITIWSDSPIERIEISDALGKKLLSSAQHHIDISDLGRGNYWVCVTFANGEKRIKSLLKQGRE